MTEHESGRWHLDTPDGFCPWADGVIACDSTCTPSEGCLLWALTTRGTQAGNYEAAFVFECHGQERPTSSQVARTTFRTREEAIRRPRAALAHKIATETRAGVYDYTIGAIPARSVK